MDEAAATLSIDAWISSYGIMTALRILDTYGVALLPEELSTFLSQPDHFYKTLLEVPISALQNNLLLEQVHGYQFSVQKMLIDYLLNYDVSSEDAQENATVLDLNDERMSVLTKNNALHALETAMHQFIAQTQSALIKLVANYQVDKNIDYKPLLKEYLNKANVFTDKLKTFHQDFSDTCLKVAALLQQLPQYYQATAVSSATLAQETF